jgi:hypothetical protein
MNLDVHLPLHDEVKQLLAVMLVLLARVNVVEQRRPQHLDILRRQPRDRKGRHGARRVPEASQRPLARQELQVVLERAGPHAVEDDGHALALGEVHDGLDDVLVRVVDHELGAVLLGEGDLVRVGGGADNSCADGSQELAEPEADSAGCGVDQRPFSFLDVVRLADEGQGREALDHARGREAGLHAIGDADHLVGWGGGVFTVGAGAEEDDVVALLQVSFVVWPNSDDGAFSFTAKDFGLGGRVEPGTEVAG